MVRNQIHLFLILALKFSQKMTFILLIFDSFYFCYQNSESNDLSPVLRSASTEDRTVILTILDGTWGSPGSVLDLFLESFRIGQKTQRFLNHLLVAALDNQAYRYCTSIHPHCFQLTPVTSKLAKRKGSTSPDDHLMLKKIKYDLLLEVIKLGYNIVFTKLIKFTFFYKNHGAFIYLRRHTVGYNSISPWLRSIY